MGCIISRSTPGTYSSDPHISSSWVYVKFIKNEAYQIWYAYNVNKRKSFRFPDLPEALLNSATAVLNRQLYVIGGTDCNGNPSNNVYMCDPVTFRWDKLRSVHKARQNAVAAQANGRIYVFGGCRNSPEDDVPWAEVYDPSTLEWNAIDNPSANLSTSLFLHPLHAVVLRDKIFIRNYLRGIAYNMTSSTWESIESKISDYWLRWTSAVEVAGMFVAYHKDRNDAVCLKSYDPERSRWLPLEFLNADAFPLAETGERFHCLSVNGNLVTYYKEERLSPLTFTVTNMQMDATRTHVTVDFRNTFNYVPKSRCLDLDGPALAANP